MLHGAREITHRVWTGRGAARVRAARRRRGSKIQTPRRAPDRCARRRRRRVGRAQLTRRARHEESACAANGAICAPRRPVGAARAPLYTPRPAHRWRKVKASPAVPTVCPKPRPRAPQTRAAPGSRGPCSASTPMARASFSPARPQPARRAARATDNSAPPPAFESAHRPPTDAAAPSSSAQQRQATGAARKARAASSSNPALPPHEARIVRAVLAAAARPAAAPARAMADDPSVVAVRTRAAAVRDQRRQLTTQDGGAACESDVSAAREREVSSALRSLVGQYEDLSAEQAAVIARLRREAAVATSDALDRRRRFESLKGALRQSVEKSVAATRRLQDQQKDVSALRRHLAASRESAEREASAAHKAMRSLRVRLATTTAEMDKAEEVHAAAQVALKEAAATAVAAVENRRVEEIAVIKRERDEEVARAKSELEEFWTFSLSAAAARDAQLADAERRCVALTLALDELRTITLAHEAVRRRDCADAKAMLDASRLEVRKLQESLATAERARRAAVTAAGEEEAAHRLSVVRFEAHLREVTANAVATCRRAVNAAEERAEARHEKLVEQMRTQSVAEQRSLKAKHQRDLIFAEDQAALLQRRAALRMQARARAQLSAAKKRYQGQTDAIESEAAVIAEERHAKLVAQATRDAEVLAEEQFEAWKLECKKEQRVKSWNDSLQESVEKTQRVAALEAELTSMSNKMTSLRGELVCAKEAANVAGLAVATERERAEKQEAMLTSASVELCATREQANIAEMRASRAERCLADTVQLRERDHVHLQQMTVAILRHKEEADTLRAEVANLQAVCTNYASEIAVSAAEQQRGLIAPKKCGLDEAAQGSGGRVPFGNTASFRQSGENDGAAGNTAIPGGKASATGLGKKYTLRVDVQPFEPKSSKQCAPAVAPTAPTRDPSLSYANLFWCPPG